jgi:TRAP-type C4-dicarboxylate transport system substrate-binding protein
MKQRRFIRDSGMALTFVFIVTLILTGLSDPTLGADVVIKGISAFPKSNPIQMTIPTMINTIEKDSGGRIKIDWLGGPEVIKTFDQGDSVRRGAVDMAIYYPFAYTKSLMPVSLAKGVSECTAWEERENGTYELWDELLQKHVNAKYIGQCQSLGRFYIFSKRKIEKLEDLKGLIIRVMPLYVPFLKALGASPVTMPPPEVYTALKRGVVDAVMWPTIISGWGWQEVVKYVVYPGIFQTEPATFINLEKWNKIPKDLQDSLINSFKKVEHIGTKEFADFAEKEWGILAKAGIKKVEFSPSDAKIYHDVAYNETWKAVIKVAPEYGPKFRALTSPCRK